MTASLPFLPYGRHVLDDQDIEAVVQVLRGDWLTTGPTIEAFEAAFAEAVQARDAIVVSSGTAALHLASLTLDFQPGQAVIVPTITFLATASAPHIAGAEIIFADVEPDTGLMGLTQFLEALERAGKKHIRAVFPVHLGGATADMKAIAAAARSRGVAVIEDACHALGTIYTTGDAHEGIVGDCHFSDMAAFSLHPVKTVAMGEGGVITTNDTAVAKKLRLLRNHGLERDSTAWRNHDLAFDGNGKPNPWYYEMHQPGFNYRATDIHCALGLSQMKKLARFVGERRRLVGIYDRLIAHLAPAIRPITRPTGCEPGWHLYTVLIDYAAIGIARADLMRRLQRRGIGTQVHYIPVHRQPYYAHHLSTPELPGARRFYERCLSLPLFPGMNEGDVMRVVDALSVEIGQDRRLDAGEKGLDR